MPHRMLHRAAVLLFAALLGCNGEPPPKAGTTAPAETTGTKPMERRGVIGVSLLTLENPFFKVIGDTISAEAKKHGYETVVLSADKDVAKQGNQVKDFLVDKVAAIVLSPCDSKSIVPVIQEANAAGVPVFTVDIPCREKGVKIVCQVATDNFNGGREAGRAIAEAFGREGGDVAIIHFKQAESCQLRVAGFREFLGEHNQMGEGKVNIVAELEGGGSRDIGYKAAEDALQGNANLRGLFCINDPSALGARAAVEKAKRTASVIIVGFDGQPEGKQAILEGKIYADPIQFPDEMGKKIVETFLKHSQGEDVPPEILIPTRLYRKADAEKELGTR